MSENFNKVGLSEEQQERQEKLAELLGIMSSVAESFIDSNDAYEVANAINDFKNKFDTDPDQDFDLRDYFLGGVLLSSDNNYDQAKYVYFDTEDEKIERFIRSLKKTKDEEKAV